MRTGIRIGIATCLAALSFSCTQQESSADLPGLIPDIDSLMSAGRADRSSIIKTSVLNGVPSTGTYPATAAVDEELDVFTALESMNRPVYRDSYSRTIRPDNTSNLMITEWIATDSAAQVRFFRLYRHDSLPGILRVEAMLKQSSLFFTKEERLNVSFDPWSGRPEHYETSGSQQIAWLSPDRYSVQARIIYKQ
ncbi:MAG: hypothetical protein ACKOAR_07685 [Bacteroidota bacterium]